MKYQELGKVTINGHLWSFGYGDAGVFNKKPCQGKCNYAQKRIIISKKHTCKLVDVVAHEVLHARFPEYNEETINDTAEIISNVYGKFFES